MPISMDCAITVCLPTGNTVPLTITVSFKEKFKISEICPFPVSIIRGTKTLKFKGEIWFLGTPLVGILVYYLGVPWYLSSWSIN